MAKIISADQAAALIKDSDCVGINGFGYGFGFPEAVAKAAEKRFKEEGHPKDLRLIYASGSGDGGKCEETFGLDHFAQPGMVKRVIAGHVGLAKAMAALINENKIEAYNFPQGVVAHLYREIAGKKPGVITHVGLKTFADPRLEGGKMNEKTKEELVELVEIDGKEQLLYRSQPINVALIRGTKIDEHGNMTLEKEGVYLETLHLAQAAKNSGGIVIAQAGELVKYGSLNVREIEIPGMLVDYIVKADMEDHKMNALTQYDPAYTGEIVIPVEAIAPMPMGARKIIARRCAMELEENTVINLGIGVPEGIAAVALEEGISDWTTMTIEAGSVGGVPGSGVNLGGSVNVEALMGQPNMFDFYDGGGLDIAFLGLAQADEKGNINVSKFNGRMVGCGGFVNITQNTRKVVFCGTFTAGKSDIEVVNGKLAIRKDGQFEKFVKQAEQVTFSGDYARESGQEVLYVTERAVFELTDRGMELIEIAPGADIEKDILAHMEFRPIISEHLKLMPPEIFRAEAMGLKRGA